MKRLQVKTINYQFGLRAVSDSNIDLLTVFDKRVNDFLATLSPENVYQISYLNSSAGMGDKINPKSILIAAIMYYEDCE